MRRSEVSHLTLIAVLLAGCGTQSAKNDRLQKTVTSTTSSDQCEGWSVHESDEFHCRIGLPAAASLENGMMHFEANKPTYTFETSQRDLSYEPQQIADETEKFLRGSDRTIVSENLDVGDGIYCRAYVHEDGGITQLGRIYINEDHVWVITATVDDEEPWDPGLEFFFDHFQPKP